ncbi:hypothetical protein [Haladaptatus salinisoli]|uniref:hypothetical protein n=1 Tax=Haladaptatus salinisoli TaxID=2884876 RepID=UPI001D0A8F91|nr:hypothetical protein [Haladaptatus salinisoli]
MTRTPTRPTVDGELLLVVVCCLMALLAAYNYRIEAYGGTVAAAAGAGIALAFLVLLSD